MLSSLWAELRAAIARLNGIDRRVFELEQQIRALEELLRDRRGT